MAGKLVKWFYQKTGPILDPGREARVEEQARAVEKELARLRQGFVLDAALRLFGVDPLDEEEVIRRAYMRFVERAWKDGELSEREESAVRWVAKTLGLPAERADELQTQHAVGRFRGLLVSAFSDGVLSDAEYGAMQSLASGLKSTVPELVRSYLNADGEGLLRTIFLSSVERGALRRDSWAQVVDTAARLGFSKEEINRLVAPYARQLIEHALADAKADEKLTAQESQHIHWLMDQLQIDPGFRAYITGELQTLKRFSDAREGKLPSVEVRGLLLAAGEIVHLHAPCVHYAVKELKAGRRTDAHEGMATITDCRFLFASATCTKELNHRKAVQILPLRGGLEVRAPGKSGGVYGFRERSDWALTVYEAAVARAKQTLVTRQEGQPSRHIPRDIRQRVWQKYAGRCAECSSDQYLEFDHIVPVARGGSSSEMNVQLLCRKCNLLKSDAI